MNERIYQRFIPQEDNTNDMIKAEDINELQRAIMDLQETSFQQADTGFLQTALFVLEHHPDANAMIADLLESASRINQSVADQVSYNEEMNSLVMDGELLQGVVTTKMVLNETGKPFEKFILLTDEYKPEGTSIQYEISYDDETYYPITANQAIPNQPPEMQAQFFLRFLFTKDNGTKQPRVDAWAILYTDSTYNYRFLDDGMNVDIQPTWDGTIVK